MLLLGAAFACTAPIPGASASSLARPLNAALGSAGGVSGAHVEDFTAGGTVLYDARGGTRRIPASVEKVSTTGTALVRLGADTTLDTSVKTDGEIDELGVLHGNLYLVGSGDPTFSSAAFARRAYGTGSTVEDLAAAVVDASGIVRVTGSVIGDESVFDQRRGTIYSGFDTNADIGGPLSALDYDRGLANEQGSAFQRRPATFAALRLAARLRKIGVPVKGKSGEGRTPPAATELAHVTSPPVRTLIRLTNIPSDNFFAEMLLKVVGARFGTAGSSAEGARVVRATLGRWGVRSSVVDGSGLSRQDRESPREIVAILRHMRSVKYFQSSLPVAARSGTLASRMHGTAAANNCRAKTGTLSNVSALAGYCRARNGHVLGFAVMNNRVDVYRARAAQDRVAIALARWNG